jgi:arginase
LDELRHRSTRTARDCGKRGALGNPVQLRGCGRGNYGGRRNLAELRSAGIEDAAHHAAAFLADAGADGVWLHFDADCLDDALVPAVDWRAEGGLSTGELVGLGRPLLESGLVAGMDGRHYPHPGLDTDDLAAGRVLVAVIEAILRA